MEALNEGASRLVPDRDLGSFEGNLRRFIRRTVAGQQATLAASLMAEAQRNQQFAVAFRDQYLARRRGAMRALFEQGLQRGEVAGDANVELLVEIAIGTGTASSRRTGPSAEAWRTSSPMHYSPYPRANTGTLERPPGVAPAATDPEPSAEPVVTSRSR